MFSGFRGDFDELGDGEFLQGGPGVVSFGEVFADDAGVDLADLRLRLAGAVVANVNGIKALIRFAAAECGEMREIHANGRAGTYTYAY